MTKTELVADLRRFTGAGLINATQLARYLGKKNVDRERQKYLKGLRPVVSKSYYIPEVAESILKGGANEEEVEKILEEA